MFKKFMMIFVFLVMCGCSPTEEKVIKKNNENKNVIIKYENKPIAENTVPDVELIPSEYEQMVEKIVTRLIKTPSSYRLIKSELETNHKYDRFTFSFDYQSVFGAIMRGHGQIYFEKENTKDFAGLLIVVGDQMVVGCNYKNIFGILTELKIDQQYHFLKWFVWIENSFGYHELDDTLSNIENELTKNNAWHLVN